MKSPKKQNVSLTLSKTAAERKWNQEALSDIIDKAVAIISPGAESNERSLKRERAWLIRTAARAVAEAIIRDGEMPLPLSVSLKHKGAEARPVFRIGLN